MAPNVVISPYRGDNGKVLIWLNSGIGDYEQYPITLSQGEEAQVEKIRRTNFLNDSEPIRYKSDDIASAFEIYRLTEKPEQYQDFVNNRRAYLTTIVEPGSQQRSSSASYVDTVFPNTKYYYMFRAVDAHNHISNPTAVYEIELVDNDGAIFMVTNIVPLEEKLPPFDTTKAAKRYIQIVPRITQGLFNQERSGLDEADSALARGTEYALGVEDESIWGRKYKVRFISKSTGRKIDLNVTYSKEHVVSPTEIALRKKGPVTLSEPETLDLLSSETGEESTETLLLLGGSSGEDDGDSSEEMLWLGIGDTNPDIDM